MGKQNFDEIYLGAVQSLGEKPSIKLSHFCDRYDPGKNYAGMIIYHSYGTHTWQQRRGQGIAGGYKGRSFYVLILCTDRWPPEALRAAGEGRVHDYLYRQYFQMEFSRKKTCCAGFAVLQGEVKYSSIWLNQQSACVNGLKWVSDGSKYMSDDEKTLVSIALAEWKLRGPGAIATVPDALHARLTRGKSSSSRDSSSSGKSSSNPSGSTPNNNPQRGFWTDALPYMLANVAVQLITAMLQPSQADT